ncbi:MAG: FtsX-like permease family protein [Burkholderiaceae bacterium]
MQRMLSLILRLSLRDWRGGELSLLMAALVVAVASLATVGFFIDRLQGALVGEAAQLLGGDLVARSSRSLPPEWRAEAERRGLRVTTTVSFPSMVSAGAAPRLASVKAFEPGYPLRGRFQVFVPDGGGETRSPPLPAPGQAWADPQLIDALGTKLGDRLTLGNGGFELAARIAIEPDRGGGFVNLAPRILIPMADLEATGLLQAGSRVSWRMLFAGSRAAVDGFEAWLRPRLQVGQRLETVEDGRPEMRATLERANQFLSLVALLSAMIAAVAVTLAARRFAERHLDASAVYKVLGLTQRRLWVLLVGELAVIAIVAGVVGTALGFALHGVLAWAIAPLLGGELPAPGWLPAGRAMLASVVLLFGFGAWPFVRLASVPPLRLLRRELGSSPPSVRIGFALALLAFAVLLYAFSSDQRLALLALIGFGIGITVFWLLGWALMRVVVSARSLPLLARRPALRVAMASWARRRGAAVVQTIALSVGLMALVLLTVTRTDLIEGWQRSVPADAPNRFVINILPSQLAAAQKRFSEAGIETAEFYPIVRGRLVKINGEPAEAYARARTGEVPRSLQRELNLSHGDDLPAHNEVVAGNWTPGRADGVSVEQGLFERLGLALGDELTFDIGGEQIQSKVTNVRKVAWDSMKVNFFMILPTATLADLPQTWITAYHQPSGSRLDRELVGAMPNLTVFDTGLILRQVQSILAQVVRAVQFLFLLTVAAGVVVLYGALASSRDERVREAGIMRALGASRRLLGSAQVLELTLTGALAGLLAGAGALVVGHVLAREVFEFTLTIRWSLLPASMGIGAALAVLAGWMGLRPVLSAAPMATLREV